MLCCIYSNKCTSNCVVLHAFYLFLFFLNNKKSSSKIFLNTVNENLLYLKINHLPNLLCRRLYCIQEKFWCLLLKQTSNALQEYIFEI